MLQTETSIHQIVENAYKVTLACAFVPLVAGLIASALGMGGGSLLAATRRR